MVLWFPTLSVTHPISIIELRLWLWVIVWPHKIICLSLDLHSFPLFLLPHSPNLPWVAFLILTPTPQHHKFNSRPGVSKRKKYKKENLKFNFRPGVSTTLLVLLATRRWQWRQSSTRWSYDMWYEIFHDIVRYYKIWYFAIICDKVFVMKKSYKTKKLQTQHEYVRWF